MADISDADDSPRPTKRARILGQPHPDFPNELDKLAKKREFIFTMNNPSPGQILSLNHLVDAEHPVVSYVFYSHEVGDKNGTPHLQGFLQTHQGTRLTVLRKLIPATDIRIMATPIFCNQNYCSKQGDPVTFGEIYTPNICKPNNKKKNQGERSDLKHFTDHINDPTQVPDIKSLRLQFPSIFCKYDAWAQTEINQVIADRVPLPVVFRLRRFQRRLLDIYRSEHQDRFIYFVIDPQGCSGKSLMSRILSLTFPNLVQPVKAGKISDMALYTRYDNKMILTDVPRSRQGVRGDEKQHDLLPYEFLEQCKDSTLASHKFYSHVKHFLVSPHMVCLTNTEPAFEKLTQDRYSMIRLSNKDKKWDDSDMADYFPEYIDMLKSKNQYDTYLKMKSDHEAGVVPVEPVNYGVSLTDDDIARQADETISKNKSLQIETHVDFSSGAGGTGYAGSYLN